MTVTWRRREFLGSLAAGGAMVLGLSAPRGAGGDEPASVLSAGEGVADITPPLGIEMGGFHRPPGQERRIRAIRQPSAVRALVLKHGGVRAAICSLDVAAVGQDMASRVRAEVERQTGIPADHVRLCATHTHSMPGFCYLRQWGAVPTEFMAHVERQTVEAVRLAAADMAPAEVHLGKARTVGANSNRTTPHYSKDDQFDAKSGDDQRWLDTALHALLLHRAGKRTLLWYHFSAHAVCHADEEAGPDWPGVVAERIRSDYPFEASFLQGHCGDVNPGDGDPWRGDLNETVQGVYPALKQAIDTARPIPIDAVRSVRREVAVPFDLALFRDWLARYAKNPGQCASGEWVDAGFAADWYRANTQRDLPGATWAVPLSALALGPIGLVFHPAELYSVYGLTIRRDSPFADTLAVGYTDGMIGYLPDPNAFAAGEYAATTVPKILDNPPFAPTAARQFTREALRLLQEAQTQPSRAERQQGA